MKLIIRIICTILLNETLILYGTENDINNNHKPEHNTPENSFRRLYDYYLNSK